FGPSTRNLVWHKTTTTTTKKLWKNFSCITAARRHRNLLNLEEVDNLEEVELFSADIGIDTTLTSKEDIKKQQSEVKARISKEFEDIYGEIIERTPLNQPIKQGIPYTYLNRLLYLIKTREEAELIPRVISRWRKKVYPMSEATTRFAIENCVKAGAIDIAFQLLTDRLRYGQLPTQRQFRVLMNAYANRINEITNRNLASDDNISISKNTKNIKNRKKSNPKQLDQAEIEDTKKKTEKNEEQEPSSPMELLDTVYKVFGLMPFYDLSQFDPHAYAILIMASTKIDSDVAWSRADETTQELINRLKTEDIKIVEAREKHDEERKARLSACIEAFTVMASAYKKRGQESMVESLETFIHDWESQMH
ncbi:7220_t:CDS:1, partial [Ambispora leptoticha]